MFRPECASPYVCVSFNRVSDRGSYVSVQMKAFAEHLEDFEAHQRGEDRWINDKLLLMNFGQKKHLSVFPSVEVDSQQAHHLS